MRSRAELLDPHVYVQAEGPRWDGRTGKLMWVDMKSDALHVADIDADGLSNRHEYRIGGPIGCVAPLAEPGTGWISAARGGFVHISEAGRLTELVGGLAPAGTYFNDGVADAHGRFWAGTQSVPRSPTSVLMSLEVDGQVVERLSCVTVSNGIVGTEDGRTLYYVDTLPHRLVEAFTVTDEGALTDRRTIVKIEDGNPDGLALDIGGGIWVAVWGAGEARRYLPDGTLTHVVAVPVPFVSAVCLVEDRLVITTARATSPDPRSGALFIADAPFPGRPALPWGGQPPIGEGP